MLCPDPLPASIAHLALPPTTYHRARIAMGIPEGHADFIPDKSFPLEYHVQCFGAIDFEKGCYTGQEVTARTYYQGTLRKRLYHVTPVEPWTMPMEALRGDTIFWRAEETSEPAKIGIIGSFDPSQGLALMNSAYAHDAHGQKKPVLLHDVPLMITPLTWQDRS